MKRTPKMTIVSTCTFADVSIKDSDRMSININTARVLQHRHSLSRTSTFKKKQRRSEYYYTTLRWMKITIVVAIHSSKGIVYNYIFPFCAL